MTKKATVVPHQQFAPSFRPPRAERYKNQSGIITPRKLQEGDFLVIGAGAIGSFLVTTLAKMGATRITVMDFDTLEEHNIANQMYPENLIGQPKVDALATTVLAYSGIQINRVNRKWTPEEAKVFVADHIIVAVDSLEVRQQVWEAYKNNPHIKMFFDGRMGAQVLRAYAVDTTNQIQKDFYEKSLYSKAAVVKERCTAKSIIYTVNLASAILLNLLKKSLNGEKRPTEIVYDCVTDTQVVTFK